MNRPEDTLIAAKTEWNLYERKNQMKLNAFLLALAVAIAPAAWAGNCPVLMVEIDEILASKPDLNEELNKSVKQLRQEGEQLHKSGKHSESVETLERALKLLKEETG